MDFDRRGILRGAAAATLAPMIARALAIDARVRTGTLADVEHIVVLTQENRSFDHYFGGLNGVRGFADRFAIPLADAPGVTGRTVWTQTGPKGEAITPFPLNTAENFALMRVEGTPHTWPDAQAAWDEGRMSRWPAAKTERSMGYYRREDIAFQYAVADAFTLCDAYHCSIHSGTNSNRLFIWTGTNDPHGRGGGPAISNSHDSLVSAGGHPDSYRWTTYAERLTAAGIAWRIYQDMADNFSDNPSAGFKTFRDSHAGLAGSDPRLAALGLSTRALTGLREDVLAGALPQVSYIVAPAKESEHPGPSSPAQGADYTARVLDALTANPESWSRTVLLVMFDENDGFFDHVPPPAPPSLAAGTPLGGSTVDTAGEYHQMRAPSEAPFERDALMGRPYGLGPRVPLYVISPWSRGGWVNSQVFDHTSIIQFMEARFGVMEPNISPWRRAVCGDLTSAFDFRTPNATPIAGRLPSTSAAAARAAALPGRTTPATPSAPGAPVQASGARPSRALPYALDVGEAWDGDRIRLSFHNLGGVGAVFHVYDRRHLDQVPRRYTVGPGLSLDGLWEADNHDLWVLGPNGFHRHFIGGHAGGDLRLSVTIEGASSRLRLDIANAGAATRRISVAPNAYHDTLATWTKSIAPGARSSHRWGLAGSAGWYDLSVRVEGDARYLRRLAGRAETGADSLSDPAMGGPAVIEQAFRT